MVKMYQQFRLPTYWYSFIAGLLALGFGVLSATAMAEAGVLYFVDAHSQIDHQTDMSLVLRRMQEHGVRKTILAARGKQTGQDIVALAESAPDKIIASIRTKGRAYSSNSKKYFKKLEKRSRSGDYGAIAEVLLYHAQKGFKAPEVSVKPDDPRVRAALAVAREHGWPFVIHIEFAALKPPQRQEFMTGLEALLKQHPQQAFVLIHMGQMEAQAVDRLIRAWPNIYFLTSHADPVTVNQSSQPWINMFSGKSFKPEWKQLMIQFPARFVFALDNVWSDHWQRSYGVKMEYWRHALAELPPNVAHAIAHGNAERLWALNTR